MKKLSALIFLLTSPLIFVVAQEPHPGGMRIQTATRQVVLFSRLEKDLNDAITQHDQAKISAMLTDDFELRIPNISGDPVPRQQWIEKVTMGEVSPGQRAGRMAVRSLADAAVVDFVEQPAGKPAGAESRFVIDVWKGSGDSWKLAARYVSKTEVESVLRNQKPTGKE